ncbi:MAG: transcriptional regulator [Kiritimatiellales bacterium]
MKAKIIKTEAECEAMLKRIEVLMDAAPGTPEEEELELLGLLVERYEQEHYPIDPPTPLAMIEFIMDQNNLTNADMVKYLGSPSKVSEVLSGKRALSKTMIRKLVEGLGIPAEILLEVETPSKVSYLPSKTAQLRVAEEGVSYGKAKGKGTSP